MWAGCRHAICVQMPFRTKWTREMSSRKFRRKSSIHHSFLEFCLPSQHAEANCPTTMVGRPCLVELFGLHASSLMGPVSNQCLPEQKTLLWLYAFRHFGQQKANINSRWLLLVTGPPAISRTFVVDVACRRQCAHSRGRWSPSEARCSVPKDLGSCCL